MRTQRHHSEYFLFTGGGACCSRIRGGISLVDTANIKALPSLDQEVAAEAFPEYSLNGNQHNANSDKTCADWVHETKDGTNFLAKGGLKAVDDAFTAGAVLVVSLWDDHDAKMLWLDSNYPSDADATQKGAYRGSCKVTSGAPTDVEKNILNATIHFSGIKWGLTQWLATL